MNGAADFDPGASIGRYRIVRTIGSGSSGTVYEAVDERLDRPVAIKFAAVGGLEDDAERKARFTRDARFAASLSHPNLCPVYDFGIHEGRPYLVSALLPGATLADLVARHAPLASDRILVLLRPIAEALAEMHRVGLYHGDLKPHNVLLDARLEPLLTDFGLARPERFVGRHRSREGAAAAFSPAYQAPEQLHTGPHAGPHIGPAADMHALGVILYVLLTGRLPFAGTAEETIQKIKETTPAAPSSIASGVPRELEQICIRLLRKDPSQRPPAVEVARRLRGLAERGTPLLSSRADMADEPTAAETSTASGVAGGPSAAAGGESPAEEPSEISRESSRSGLLRGVLRAVPVLLLLAVGYAVYVTAPWEWLASRVSSILTPVPTVDSGPPVDIEVPPSGGSVAGEGAPGGGGSTGGGEPRPPRVDQPSPRAVDEIEPGFPTPPGPLFVGSQLTVAAAATLPAGAQGNAVLWWEPESSSSATVAAESLIPAREGTGIAGVLTSASGETVAILGHSWYGRVAAAGGAVATNRVAGYLTVEQAATTPTGRFALLQPTALDGRKRIAVWDVADGANPVDRMAIYCDASTTALALSPSGRGLAYGGQGGRVTIQGVGEDPQVVGELDVPGAITALAFGPDNSQLAVGHQGGEDDPAGIVVFEYAEYAWTQRRRIRTGERGVRHLVWSPSAGWLGGVMPAQPIASSTGQAGEEEAPVPPPPAPAWLWRMEPSAESATMVDGGSDERLVIPDVAGTAIAFAAEDQLLVGHGDGLIRRWQLPP